MDNWRENIAKNLKMWREAHKMTQDELAEKVDCSKSVIRDLEIKKGSASLDMVSRIADALNISMETLLRSGTSHRGLLVPEINEIAEGASFNVLLDIVFKKVRAVPEDIVEMAYYYKPREATWEIIRGALDFDLKEQSKEKNEGQA
jgi:transcriptional regulator with XRE-family HTH domain